MCSPVVLYSNFSFSGLPHVTMKYWFCFHQLNIYLSVLQHSIWLDDAFDRARQLYLSYYRSIPKSLERATAHKLMIAMLNGDERFVEPTPESLQNLTLKSVKDAVMNQFVGGNMEVCRYLYINNIHI